jgi:hypothetical protein
MKAIKQLIRDISNTSNAEIMQIGSDGFKFGLVFMGVRPEKLIVLCSNSAHWDHVSVSGEYRTPSWEAMCHIKELCFNEDETVVQYHVPCKHWINDHPHCLHLWKPQTRAIPRPPEKLV